MAILPSTHEHRSDPLRADAGARFFSGVRWGFLQQGARRLHGRSARSNSFGFKRKNWYFSLVDSATLTLLLPAQFWGEPLNWHSLFWIQLPLF